MLLFNMTSEQAVFGWSSYMIQIYLKKLVMVDMTIKLDNSRKKENQVLVSRILEVASVREKNVSGRDWGVDFIAFGKRDQVRN